MSNMNFHFDKLKQKEVKELTRIENIKLKWHARCEFMYKLGITPVSEQDWIYQSDLSSRYEKG